MAVNLVDKLVSLIPAHIVDGKDVSKTILVDTNENPILMKNRAVLRTAEKRFDVYGDSGTLSFSIALDDFDDSQIQAAIAALNTSVSALETDVAEAGVTAGQAKAQSELNKEDIVTLTTTANAADSLSKANQSNLNELSITVGGNAAAISANANGIENNIAAIAAKTDQADHDGLVTTVSGKASQTDLNAVSTTATAADTLSKTNAGLINDVSQEAASAKTEANTAKLLAEGNRADIDTLSGTVGSNTAQISTNTKNIGDNTTAIGLKADQSALDTVSAKANAADTLSKANATRLDGVDTTLSDVEQEILSTKQIAQKADQDVTALGVTVGSNTSQISSNTSAISSNATDIASKASQSDLNSVSATATAADTLSKANASSITGLNSAVDNNTAAIATKASQTELDTVKGKANAADSRSLSNEAKLAGKVGTDSNASLNNLTVKNNITMGDGAGYITGLTDAASALDAMNKRSVEVLTNALSTRIDNVAAGAGDESDFITVDGFNKMITENGVNLLERLKELDGDTQCHIAFNEIRAARPAANPSQDKWVMYGFANANNPIWKFAPETGIPLKDGIISIEHTSDSGVSLRIVTESTILVKTMHYYFGTGNNGRRNDWQVWQPRVKGYEGFNKGQILTDADITWQTSSNIRTNMQRLRDAIPNGCTFIGWHNHSSKDNRYRVIAKGNSSDIEGTTGTFIIWRHGGTSSTAGLYINSASSSAEGWARSYIGSANAWVTFGKQENRSTASRFEGASEVSVPFYEDPPELTLYVIASFSNDLTQLVAKDDDGDYQSVGRYGVNWDGTWTRDEAYHTAFYRQESNTYIAFNYLTFKWEKFTAAKQHTFIGQQAIANSIQQFAERSQFPVEGSIYVSFGDLDTLAYEQISQPTIVHDNASLTSSIQFGAPRWGYVEGGGVPSDGGDYPDDGYDPVIEEPEE